MSLNTSHELRGEDASPQELRELARDLVLPSQESAVERQPKRQPHRVHGREHERQREPVGGVADRGAAHGEAPPRVPQQPLEHLHDAEEKAEIQPAPSNEDELLSAAPLKQLDDDALIPRHRAHDLRLHVPHLRHALLHLPEHGGDELRAVPTRERGGALRQPRALSRDGQRAAAFHPV
eukprot:30787-Pelagococcus_subviridis.AAC.5